jgi:phosphohistidine phosphatase
MLLYILRHAIAEERDLEKWSDDGERPLTAEGIKRFRKGARGLVDLADELDRVLSSPLRRAWQTAEILANRAKLPDPVVCPELEPDRDPADLLAVLTELGAQSVTVVGHEPHLTRLLSLALTGEPHRLRGELKKGGAACISWDGPAAPGAAELHWLMTARMLRELR